MARTPQKGRIPPRPTGPVPAGAQAAGTGSNSGWSAMVKTLQDQNQILLDVASNTQSTEDSLDKFIKYLSDRDKKMALLEKEKLTEARKKASAAVTKKSKGGGWEDSTAASAEKGVKGVIPSWLGGAAAGAAAAFGTRAMMRLAKRGVPALIATAFADDIHDWIVERGGSEELAEAAERAVIGGAFGLILGKRFGLIGAALGALATDENVEATSKATKEMKENIKKHWDEKVKPFLDDWGLFVPAFSDIVTTIGSFSNQSFKDATKALVGFTESGFDSEEFQENWKSALGVLGLTAAVLMPGKFLKTLRFLAQFGKKNKKLMAILGVAGGATWIYEKMFGADPNTEIPGDGNFNDPLLDDQDPLYSDKVPTAALGTATGVATVYSAQKMAEAMRNKYNAYRGAPHSYGSNFKGGGSASGSNNPTKGKARGTAVRGRNKIGVVYQAANGAKYVLLKNSKGQVYSTFVKGSYGVGDKFKVPTNWWHKLLPSGNFGSLLRKFFGGGVGVAFAIVFDGPEFWAMINPDNEPHWPNEQGGGPMTWQERTSRAAQLVAANVGGGVFAAMGFAVGWAGGPWGAALATIVGGAAGYMASEWLARNTLDWIFGLDNGKLLQKSVDQLHQSGELELIPPMDRGPYIAPDGTMGQDFLVTPDAFGLGLGGSDNNPMAGDGIIKIPNFGAGAQFNLHKMNYSPGATQGISMHSSGPGGPFSKVPRHSINMASAIQAKYSGGSPWASQNPSPIVVQNTDQSQTVQNSQALVMGGSVADNDDLLEASDWLRWA